MEGKKTIGVLTSGGDAPGMNAAVRAVVRTGIIKNMRVMGIRRGYSGLIAGDMEIMERNSVSEIIQHGGTMLYTARCKEFESEEGRKKAVATCKAYQVNGLVVIGGDGSFRGANELSKYGIPVVGIPGTIDNDISSTDYTIGFDTACNIAVEAVDRLRDTTQSHERCSVVEVMGRHAGYLAVQTAIATGAVACAVPERPFDFDGLCEKIIYGRLSGKTHHIIIVAEGYPGGGKAICDMLEEKMGIDVRLTVLGHIQRGGSPTMTDRVMATRMGHHAVELLEKMTEGGRIVACRDGKIVDYDINEALEMKKSLDDGLYELTSGMSGVIVR